MLSGQAVRTTRLQVWTASCSSHTLTGIISRASAKLSVTDGVPQLSKFTQTMGLEFHSIRGVQYQYEVSKLLNTLQ